jgi:hypothetical protein
MEKKVMNNSSKILMGLLLIGSSLSASKNNSDSFGDFVDVTAPKKGDKGFDAFKKQRENNDFYSDVSGSVKDYAKDAAVKAADDILGKNEDAVKVCTESALLGTSFPMEYSFNRFMEYYGINWLPIQMLERVKRAFYECLCQSPGTVASAGATALATENPVPLFAPASKCSGAIFKALAAELGAWSKWFGLNSNNENEEEVLIVE